MTTTESSGKRVAVGALFGIGAQAATFLLQFSYAAVTSRLVDVDGFGQYAIGLAASALFVMIATAGVGESAMLLSEPLKESLRPVFGIALLSGVLLSGLLAVLSQPWATVWGDPSSVSSVRVIAVSVLIAPTTVLMAGLARRKGAFRLLAIVTVMSNALAMAAGALLVVATREGWALAVSAVLTQAIQVAALAVLLRIPLIPSFRFRAIKTQLRFVWKVLGWGLIAYSGRNVLRFGTARFLGTADYGNWNRAEVITSVPLQSLEMSLTQVVYTEYRRDIPGTERTKKNWTEAIILCSWIALPISGVLAVVAPTAMPILFGGGWETAAEMAPYLAIAAGLQMAGMFLPAGLQALGYHRANWISESCVLFVTFCFLGILWWRRDILVVCAGVIAAPIVRNMFGIQFARRYELIHAMDVLRGVTFAAAAAVVTASTAWVALEVISTESMPFYIRAIVTAALLSSSILVIALLRRVLPPILILSRILGRNA